MANAGGTGTGPIIEFRRIGQALRVVAIDPVTGTEVTMIGDPRASQQEMSRLAAQKLQFVLNKQQGKP